MGLNTITFNEFGFRNIQKKMNDKPKDYHKEYKILKNDMKKPLRFMNS